jgi:hypothetical protein
MNARPGRARSLPGPAGILSAPEQVTDLRAIVSAALQLGAEDVSGWSDAEKKLVRGAKATRWDVAELRDRIRAGEDPLGEAFCQVRSSEERRPLGQTYTPDSIVTSMIDWADGLERPTRVVDPGTGSARYLLAAGRRWRTATLVGIEVDPVAAIVARGNLAAAGLASRASVAVTDYRELALELIDGRTLYIGNPPYVRHHQIEPRWKQWLVSLARKHGHDASQLAGLHVHFFLATAAHGQPDDYGAFITSAEWLDVNYGRLVRELLLDGLGGQAIHVLEPTAAPFADATTTGAIACFRLGSRPSSLRLRRVKRVEDLGKLEGGRKLARERLAEAARWGPLTRVSPKLPEGYVELGELCRVHRGAVTGANDIWVQPRGAVELPDNVLYPSVTRAHELFSAGIELADATKLRLVVDLPPELDSFDQDERKLIDKFLRRARKAGAADGYIARNRKAWWSVGLRRAAPLLATYMARRPPAFVCNLADARHINIAHGIYPRDTMSAAALARLAEHLRTSVSLGQGRVYAGGLTKFEPKEMERLPVPTLEALLAP